MTVHVKDAGVWKPIQPFDKRNDAWTEPDQMWVKDGGIWKKVYQADNTPPAVPVLTLSVIDGRYVSVAIKANTVADTDLDRVRVLVGNGNYPANQFSSGFVNTPDDDYPNEPWSEYLYNVTGGHTVTTQYSKGYPPNPNATTQMSGGVYAYFGAWAKDFRGNWSAGNFQRIWLPDRTTPSLPPTQTIKTATWTADWSEDFLQTGELRWNTGVNNYMGLWESFAGWQYTVVGFPHEKIVATLKNATVLKVEFYMYAQKAYNKTFNARYRYHSASAPQPTIGDIPRFGTFHQVAFTNAQGQWVDITSQGTAGWKAGTTRGISFEPANALRSYSGLFDGHKQLHPPKLRITYQV
jgi:hypothetical protein